MEVPCVCLKQGKWLLIDTKWMRLTSGAMQLMIFALLWSLTCALEQMGCLVKMAMLRMEKKHGVQLYCFVPFQSHLASEQSQETNEKPKELTFAKQLSLPEKLF